MAGWTVLVLVVAVTVWRLAQNPLVIARLRAATLLRPLSSQLATLTSIGKALADTDTDAGVTERLRRLLPAEVWPADELSHLHLRLLLDGGDAERWAAAAQVATGADAARFAGEATLRAVSAAPTVGPDTLVAAPPQAPTDPPALRQAYAFLTEHGSRLPKVDQVLRSAEVARLGGDAELAARAIELATSRPVTDLPPAALSEAWERLGDRLVKSWMEPGQVGGSDATLTTPAAGREQHRTGAADPLERLFGDDGGAWLDALPDDEPRLAWLLECWLRTNWLGEPAPTLDVSEREWREAALNTTLHRILTECRLPPRWAVSYVPAAELARLRRALGLVVRWRWRHWGDDLTACYQARTAEALRTWARGVRVR